MPGPGAPGGPVAFLGVGPFFLACGAARLGLGGFFNLPAICCYVICKGVRQMVNAVCRVLRALSWPQGGLSFSTALPPARPGGVG
jgi:hypothetical protein